MSLDSYIFKTTKKGVMAKKKEIINARNKDLSQGVKCGNQTVFVYRLGDDRSNAIDHLKPDVHWRRYNHITAWISEKVFGNTGGKMDKYIGVLTKEDLLALKDDCWKVFQHCILPDGTLSIDETYCAEIFPTLNMAYSGSAAYDKDFIEEIFNALDGIERLLRLATRPDVCFVFFAYF